MNRRFKSKRERERGRERERNRERWRQWEGGSEKRRERWRRRFETDSFKVFFSFLSTSRNGHYFKFDRTSKKMKVRQD